jgi:serine/threonine protein kinase
MSTPRFPLYTGETIDAGRLRLHSILGQGGFGVVYRAYDTSTHKTYAVKWLGLPFEYRNNTDAEIDAYYALLRTEIDAHERASDLPGVVTLHRTVTDDTRSCFWLVLNFVRGGDVFDAVKLHNPFWCNEKRTRSVVLQLIDAVAALHAQKVYHRDIKPENVLLSVDARTVYLSDFGSATSAQYTKQRVGTAEYSPPGKSLFPAQFSNKY